MKLVRNITKLLLSLPLWGGLGWGLCASCTEETGEWNPYENWETRNAEWFRAATDSARQNKDGRWLRFRTLAQAQGTNTGVYTDSIVVHVFRSGAEDHVVAHTCQNSQCGLTPVWTDSVRLNFRGWLCPTTYRIYNAQGVEVDSVRQEVFTQNFYGTFDRATAERTATPSLMLCPEMIEGFGTAVQHMHKGDIWDVYIPQQLAYKGEVKGTIPAYSTLLFRLHLVDFYHVGERVPEW